MMQPESVSKKEMRHGRFLLGVAWPIFKQTPFWKRLDATLWYILRDFPENMCMKFGLVSSFMTPTCPDILENHVSCVQKDVFQNTIFFANQKDMGIESWPRMTMRSRVFQALLVRQKLMGISKRSCRDRRYDELAETPKVRPKSNLVINTPPKLNMEPENDGFQKESPFPGFDF